MYEEEEEERRRPKGIGGGRAGEKEGVGEGIGRLKTVDRPGGPFSI